MSGETETALAFLGVGNLAPWAMLLTGRWRVSTRPAKKAAPVTVLVNGETAEQPAVTSVPKQRSA